jgi:hypothetical protein
MPALSAMRFNPAVAALVARLKDAGRLTPKPIVVAAMRKRLVIWSSPLAHLIQRAEAQAAF